MPLPRSVTGDATFPPSAHRSRLGDAHSLLRTCHWSIRETYTPCPWFSCTTTSSSLTVQLRMGSLLPSTAGIETVGAAVLFAVLYAALVPVYLWKTARHPTYTFIVLIIFCLCE